MVHTNNKNIRITQKNVLMGINHAETRGKHKLEKNVNVVGPNVRTADLTNRNYRMDLNPDDIENDVGLDYKKVAENEFMAESSDMRGYKNAKTYRGSTVYEWNPARDFRPDAVGYIQGAGAFQGGFVNEALKRSRKGYAPAMGHQQSGIAYSNETVKNVNPFSIKLNVSPASLKTF